jgi:RNA polymerase nonessential primary-like sigma factor
VEEIHTLMERGGPVASLDAMLYNMEDFSLMDSLADPASLDNEEKEMAIDLETRMPLVLYSIEQLPEKERMFIQKRFGVNGYVPHSYQEIATTCEISRERVRQVIETGLRRVRYQMSKQGRLVSAA